MNLKETSREQIDRTLFESYLDGLRDSGCRVDPLWVRFGYTASAALRVGIFLITLLEQEIKQGTLAAEPAAEEQPQSDCFEVVMAEEAYVLLEAIG
jgi:hypothetical protein